MSSLFGDSVANPSYWDDLMTPEMMAAYEEGLRVRFSTLRKPMRVCKPLRLKRTG